MNRLSVRAFNRVIRILPSKALRLFLECLYCRVGPPVPQSSTFIVLSTGIVKGMTELMGCNGSKGAVVQIVGPGGAEEWRLQNASGEYNFPVRRRVVSIDLGRRTPQNQ